MESAEIIFVVANTYGFARVVRFKNRKSLPTTKDEEIMFHINDGCTIKQGGRKPKFNYKKRIARIPAAGNFITFIRKRSKKNNHRDTALVWGLRGSYMETWQNINCRKKKEAKQQKLNRLFKIIKAEKPKEHQETRKAL